MKGYKRKRGDNSWEISVCKGKNPETNKYDYIRKTVKGNAKAADEEIARIIAQLSAGEVVDTSKLTLLDLFNRWMNDYVKVNLEQETIRDYDMVTRLYFKPLHHVPLVKLSPLGIQQVYNDIAAKVSSASARKAHKILHAALGKGVKWGLIGKNIADHVDIPQVGKTEQKVLLPDQVKQFLAVAKKSANPQDFVVFLLAIHTGIRRGELGGLRWSDVNFDTNLISIRQTLKRSKIEAPVFGKVKTKKSDRPIVMSPALNKALKEHRNRQLKERLAAGANWMDYDLVFTSGNGLPLDVNNLSRYLFKNILKKAGLDNMKYHGLRHSFATFLLSEGVNPKIVQEMLGHSSIGITLDTYSHVLPTLQKEAVQKINKKLSV